jgi:hypothetical protein
VHHPGVHAPILDRDLFDEVQRRLDAQAVARRTSNTRHAAPLAGLLYDDRGHRMGPAGTVKNGRRHRYHVSAALLDGDRSQAGSQPRVPAAAVEDAVRQALEKEIAQRDDDRSNAAAPLDPHALIATHLQRVVVGQGKLVLTLADGRSVEAPFTPRPPLPHREVLVPPDADPGRVEPMRADARLALLLAIARARRWAARLEAAPETPLGALAAEAGITPRYLRMLLPLAYLDPGILQAVLDRRVPDGFGVARFAAELPVLPADQRRWIGLA